ncbi:unnamed protein product [Prorocentrum cordatum]|uniref:Uncharacterized protein n=1 Tax=Prorocentrum cordatum TaxID=2364126 RepID=A0ABN9W082_9DINO|nr:unnamed protein product [Polarella glacialis]
MAPKLDPNKRARLSAQQPETLGSPGRSSAPQGQTPPRNLRALSAAAQASIASSPAQQPKPDNADVVMTVRKCSDCVRALWADAPAGESLFAIRLGHGAWPTVQSQLTGAFGDFLKAQHEEDGSWPMNLKQLREAQNAVVKITNPDDPNEQTFSIDAWSVAFWVSGNADDVTNALRMLDAFVMHRIEHPRTSDKKTRPPLKNMRVKVYLSSGSDVQCESDGHNVATEIFRDVANPPFSLLSVAPPFATRMLLASAEIVDRDRIIVRLDGRTCPWKAHFDRAGVPRVDSNLGLLPPNFTDVSVGENCDNIIRLFTDILGNAARRLPAKWADVPNEGPVEKLLVEVAAMPHVFTDVIKHGDS